MLNENIRLDLTRSRQRNEESGHRELVGVRANRRDEPEEGTPKCGELKTLLNWTSTKGVGLSACSSASHRDAAWG